MIAAMALALAGICAAATAVGLGVRHALADERARRWETDTK